LPAAGATVELRAEGGRVAAQTTSATGGRFELRGTPGTWVLTGHLDGQPLEAKSVTLVDGSTQVMDLSAAKQSARLTGHVLDAVTRKPIGNALVEVHRAGYGIIATTMAVSPDGHFSVEVPAADA